MFGFFCRKKGIDLYAPVEGKVVDLTEVPDAIFSQKMMGDGIAIEPTGSLLMAPCDGRIAFISETKHALAIITGGVEVLMHIGIDTVELDGQAFDVHVKINDEVKKGDKLITFDHEVITKSGKLLITPVVVINMDKVKKLDKYMNDSSDKILTIEMK